MFKFLAILAILAVVVIADGILPTSKEARNGNSHGEWKDVRARRVKICTYATTDYGCNVPLTCLRTYAGQCNDFSDGNSQIIFVNSTSATFVNYRGLDCQTLSSTLTAADSVTLDICTTVPSAAASGVNVNIKVFAHNY